MTTFSLCLLLLAARQDPSVERLIQQLGHDEVQVREEAARRLIEAGKPALPLLREAAKKGDAEVRERVLEVLKAIDRRILNGRDLWSRRDQGSMGPLVHDSGKLYYFVRRREPPKPEQKLVCVDAATGREEWSTTLYQDFRSCDSSFVHLRVRGGFVVFSDIGETFCLDARMGKTLWSIAAGGWRGYGPQLAGNIALVTRPDKEKSGEALGAYDLGTGRLLWEHPSTKPEGAIHPVATFEKRFLLWDGKSVSCLDAETGRPLWEREAPAEDLRFYAPGTLTRWELNLSKGVLTDDSSLYLSVGHALLRWDLQGRAAWTANVPGRLQLLGQDPRRLYGATASGQIVAVSKEDGSQVWRTEPPAALNAGEWEAHIRSSALVDHRLLILLRPHGRVRHDQTVVQGYDLETGKALWAVPAGPHGNELPRGASKGGLYIAGEPTQAWNEKVCRIDLETGTAALLDRPAPPRTPLLVGDILYCVTEHELTAIRLND